MLYILLSKAINLSKNKESYPERPTRVSNVKLNFSESLYLKSSFSMELAGKVFRKLTTWFNQYISVMNFCFVNNRLSINIFGFF